MKIKNIIISVLTILSIAGILFLQHTNYESQRVLIQTMESDLIQSMRDMNNEYLATMEQLSTLPVTSKRLVVPTNLKVTKIMRR